MIRRALELVSLKAARPEELQTFGASEPQSVSPESPVALASVQE